MSERSRSKGEFFPTQAELLEEETVRRLIDEQRVPSFMSASKGSGGESREVVLMVVPPPGTNFGDTIVRDISHAGVVGELISPEGKSRGASSIYEFDSEIGRVLRNRTNKILKEKGLSLSLLQTIKYDLRYEWENFKSFFTDF